jgi:hypothetical protein
MTINLPFSIDFLCINTYLFNMDIQRLSMDMAQTRLQDQVGSKVMSMALGQAKEQSAALLKLMDSANLPAATDPALGNRVNLLV